MDLLKKIVVSGGFILVGIIFGYSFHSNPVSTPQPAQTQIQASPESKDVEGISTASATIAPRISSLEPVPTPITTLRPKATLKPIPKSTPLPTIKATPPPSAPYVCNCSKTCTQISSCAEAQYLLTVCGCGARDGDNDGIACDSAPLHCQN